MKLVDQWGRPFDSRELREPQTARVGALDNEFLTSNLDGLTPSRLAATLRAADAGDLTAQARLFADMEERDAHLSAELGKRKLALLGLDWTIVPPRNATAAERAHAEWLTEVLTDAVDPVEDLILALMDGVGHGFAMTELEWRQEAGEWLPSFHPRPQEWFQLGSGRRELRLRDMSVDGAPLTPFGWVAHTHGKAKTGYLGRMGLHRVLSWPFLYKAYAVSDFAEFLETFGLPFITGKYFKHADEAEKDSLFRAVTALGHDARAIMPADMEVEIHKITGGGDAVHLSMVDWADRAQSKAILGQTMSAESKSSGLGSGNAQLHAEVRRDILVADARQIAGTLTRDLLYPLIALNRGGLDGLRRCPRWIFDTGEADDLALYAESLPKLVGIGMRIPVEWVHDKLRIPQPEKGGAVLATAAPTPTPASAQAVPPVALTALAAGVPAKSGVEAAFPDVALSASLAPHGDAEVSGWVAQLSALVAQHSDLPTLRQAIVDAYGDLDSSNLVQVMAAAMALAELRGIDAVRSEAAGDA